MEENPVLVEMREIAPDARYHIITLNRRSGSTPLSALWCASSPPRSTRPGETPPAAPCC